MRKYLLAGSALVAALSIATAANAADMTAPATYDWTGFYLGANAGVAWSNASIDQNTYIDGVRVPALSNSLDGNNTAFTAGGILGYNYQMDQIVLGAEADFNYLGFSNDRRRNIDDGVYATTNFEADWYGTIRARLGFAVDNLLIYGTGGAAYGNMNADGKLVVGDAVWKGSTDDTRWGWTLGAGAEYGIDNWSLGVEYLYVDLGSDNYKSNTIDLDPGLANFKGDVDYAFSTVRATVKYRFQ
ncbi:porin family protein [Aestuariivirga litoralis]|uniref:Porin family protein n=1 Tax=Aestuariivirga litoralis TaxID=2650924 RepID=A0A2W2ARK9_9HYPH|nr:outer membrane protein [Aestuariivirga litoralis]PZF75120.1 porin family protein [Aestuariivirga litoralis]